jgi:protein-tyrosine kinase
MDKIIAALEKASKQKGQGTGQRGKSQKKESPHPPTTGNVVPFTSPDTTIGEKDLHRTLVAFHQPRSVEAELFNVLRTKLRFPSEGRPPRSILVTSAIPGEGKSFVAANLAISIARGVEEHVLLVDSDVRQPSIHKFFGFGRTAGLIDYLQTGSDVAQHFVKTPVDKLTILPAGTPPANPTELLTTQKMKSLLDEVVQRYDDRFIIIDSAPPSLASETEAISKYVDGFIIVIRADKTPRKEVTEVIEQLGKEKVLGIVMNHSEKIAKKYYEYKKSYPTP